jgi:hypothetical protein
MTCQHCGEAARFVDYRDKDLLSLLGVMRVARGYYHCRHCGASQGPEFGRHRVEMVWHKKPDGKPPGQPGDPGFTTDDLVQTLPAIYNSKTTLAADVQPGCGTPSCFAKQPRNRCPPSSSSGGGTGRACLVSTACPAAP